MMNLLGTVAWLETLLTLEIGTTAKTKLALMRDGSSVQNTEDFMVCKRVVNHLGRKRILYS